MVISLPFGFPCKLFLSMDEVRFASSIHLPSGLTKPFISFMLNLFESLLNLSPETLCKVQFPKISFNQNLLWFEKEGSLAGVILSPPNQEELEEKIDKLLMKANYGQYADYIWQNKELPHFEPFIPLFESFKSNFHSLRNKIDKARRRRKEKPLLWFHIAKSGIVLFHFFTKEYGELKTLELEIILTRKDNALHIFNLVEKEVFSLPEVYNSPKKRTQAYKLFIIPITLKLYRRGLPNTEAQLKQLIKDEVFNLLNPPKKTSLSKNKTHFTDARSETKRVCSACGKTHDENSKVCSTCRAELSYLRKILDELPEDKKQAYLNQNLTQDELQKLRETLKAKGKIALANRLKALYEKVPKLKRFLGNV